MSTSFVSLKNNWSTLKKEPSDTCSGHLESELEESDELMVLQATLEKDIFNSSVRDQERTFHLCICICYYLLECFREQVCEVAKARCAFFQWEPPQLAFFLGTILSVNTQPPQIFQLGKAPVSATVTERWFRKGRDRRTPCLGDNYAEANKYLQSRYDSPRLIHQTHVRMILDAPALKDGTGK